MRTTIELARDPAAAVERITRIRLEALQTASNLFAGQLRPRNALDADLLLHETFLANLHLIVLKGHLYPDPGAYQQRHESPSDHAKAKQRVASVRSKNLSMQVRERFRAA